ncbi:type 1 glutamine amidotransferase domain-containing protein [Meridianimarinicoccus aquatilis]|uniref:Type 1 glutamine amidotransferase domain-containing protein n=1 Tax=Meridianimarinicoccus aquatilis TaxID=2552766 RepID=A0A4R6B5F2_9RHOB|nr:type 1 glutamine amidotransferase domain-containing protein [Fluviibacterium aquatile]QIE42004.1 type 1 glutamine amidotransferase domain-containing protein [Rhodobacteraceae bacterium SC52]TDL90703.1 type 1 glutamine amidotransferase domain-containing protein [Fluviibacterium aquatile]
MTHPKKILIIATSAHDMGEGKGETGLWLEELTTPYYAFIDAGADVTLASIKGGEIPIDARSLNEEGEKPESVQRYEDDAAFQEAVRTSHCFSRLPASGYDAIFLPGGHGTMFDYPNSHALAEMVTETIESGRIVAAVCHGPAGLVSALSSDGTPLVKGRKVTGFTDGEERAVGLDEAVPFLLETRLKDLGADYSKGEDFSVYAVRDGGLITGQNPMSAGKTAELVMEALTERQAA